MAFNRSNSGRQAFGIAAALVVVVAMFQLFFRYQYIHTYGAEITRVDRLTGQSCEMPCVNAPSPHSTSSTTVTNATVSWVSSDLGADWQPATKAATAPPGYVIDPFASVATKAQCNDVLTYGAQEDGSGSFYVILSVSKGTVSKGDTLSGDFTGFRTPRVFHNVSTGSDMTATPVYHSGALDGVESAMARFHCNYNS